MKNYKKFYEVGNNRYYTIIADDELYLGTESFLDIGRKRLFKKNNSLNVGFKLLKMSAPITKLLVALDNLKPSKKQRYDYNDFKDMTIYEKIDNIRLKEEIKQDYSKVINDEIDNMIKQQKHFIDEGKTDLAKSCENYINDLKHLNPLGNIDLETPSFTGCMLIKTMLRSGLKHLYTERVNAFANNVFLYEQDCFGTLTIYKVITVKNVVKNIDTFIYDKNVVSNLLKYLYEEGR